MEEKTKAQQLVEIASWVKAQNPEFTKHFKTMKAILKVYKELPADYDKKKSVVAYINKGIKSKDVSLKQRAEHLALIFNALFGFRYFTDAPFRYLLRLGLRRWTDRKDEVVMEVRLERVDHCNPLDDFRSSEYGAITTRIKSLGDAKRAVDRLLNDVTTKSNDYEVKDGESRKNPYRTGRLVGCSKDFKERNNIGSPIVYMEKTLFSRLFNEALKSDEAK